MYDLANDYLTAVVAAMETTDAGGPDRYAVVLGDPVFDTLCAQAFVSVPTLTEGNTGPNSPPEATGNRTLRGRLNLVGMTAWAVRCISVQNGNRAVTDEQFGADAKAGYEDGWAIWNYVTRAINVDTLFSGPCSVNHFDGGAAITPSGGLGGWRFTIRVELQGYDPT